MDIQIVPPCMGDTTAFYNLIDRNRAHLKNMKWSASATLDSTREMLRGVIGSEEKFYFVMVNGAILGCVTLCRLRDIADRYMIGYWVDNGIRMRGVATEAVRQVLEIENETTVIAKVRIRNEASQKVLYKNNFIIDDMDDEWMTLVWER